MNTLNEHNETAWSGIVLPEEQLVELKKQAEMFLANHPACPQGTLLHGVPGTGKTLLVTTVARAVGSTFLRATLADLKIPVLGASGQKVRELWEKARDEKPTILFVDECESIFSRRSSADTDVIAADLTQAFLAEWNAREDGVWLIAATNRRDRIDEAILSRFGSEFVLALPNAKQRESILNKELAAVGLQSEIPQSYSTLTQGMSGRDLSQLASKIMRDAYPGQPGREHFAAMLHAMRRTGNTEVDSTASWQTLVVDQITLTKLKTICDLIKDGEAWRAMGITVPAALLLCGEPGTGKTQIARTIANESGLAFLSATSAEMKGNYIGHSGNNVKTLFESARAQAPSILFIDELDVVAPSRLSAEHDAFTTEIVGQLLQEMDGICRNSNHVFVLAATNHESLIDSAILSRMQERITIPMPDASARTRLLLVILQKKKIDFILAEKAPYLAALSDGMTGRDIGSWIARAENTGVHLAKMLGGPKYFKLRLRDLIDAAMAYRKEELLTP